MYRVLLITALSLVFCLDSSAQTSTNVVIPKAKADKTGSFYASWGWNEDRYTKSDIQFIGDNYDFTLSDVKGTQRQEKFTVNRFLNPATVSIPQFNFRLGYYLSNDFDIFGGVDHMKYVVLEGQNVPISGSIRNSETVHDGEYAGELKEITNDFLDYEHTDGLNFVFIGARKSHTFFTKKWVSLGAYETFAVGVMRPRSDVTLLGKERHDEYNIAGLAFSASGGLELGLWRHFFLQSEMKGGFTTMPWIRTTFEKADKAKQNFWFGQAVVQFGGRWSFGKGKNASS
ncbi:MAG: hypothetical protein AB8F78_05480 [Saprospiraceae bacterium]